MVTHILDTNICIYIIKKSPSQVFEKFREMIPGTIGISSITVAELMHGVNKSALPEKNLQALEEFLKPLEILPFDYPATLRYGIIKTLLGKKGILIGPLDTLIAAHALSLGATIVTNNIKEFNRVEGLTTENWINT